MAKEINKTTMDKGNRKNAKKDYVYAVARQKEAVARVRLHSHVKEGHMWGTNEVKKEQILVNQMPIEHYFSGPLAKASYMEPLHLTNTINKYAITVKVSGGGKDGQLDAITKGIAKALASIDPLKFRSILKKKGFLTRDARVRERRKVGHGGKARREKQSPKR